MKPSLKIMITVALCSLSMSAAAFGQIGDTKEQCIERYGKPASLGPMLLFIKGDNLVTCQFSKGICIFVTFESIREKFTAEEFIAILKENTSDTQEWYTFEDMQRLSGKSPSEMKRLSEDPSEIKHFPSSGEYLGCLRSDGVAAFDEKGKIILAVSKGSPLMIALNKLPEKKQASDPWVLSDEVLAKFTEFNLNKQKQEVFEKFHPAGTAKHITVHECKVEWKTPKPTDNPDDIRKFTLRYTIYWEGPIEKDGYTKIGATFDGEVKRFTESQVLATNGITNSDVSQAMMAFGAELLRGMVQRQ